MVKSIKIAEAKIEAPPTQPQPTPTPSPTPSPTVLTPEEWLNQHLRVKNKVEEYASRGICVTPDVIAKELNLSEDTVLTHLEVMKADEDAKDVAEVNGKKVYCSYNLIRKLMDEMRGD